MLVAFLDVQLKPYHSDDFITRLFYESNRFAACNLFFSVRVHVNDNKKNPNLSLERSMTYSLVNSNIPFS